MCGLLARAAGLWYLNAKGEPELEYPEPMIKIEQMGMTGDKIPVPETVKDYFEEEAEGEAFFENARVGCVYVTYVAQNTENEKEYITMNLTLSPISDGKKIVLDYLPFQKSQVIPRNNRKADIEIKKQSFEIYPKVISSGEKFTIFFSVTYSYNGVNTDYTRLIDGCIPQKS